MAKMSSLALLYRRIKRIIFFLIIFYLVRSYFLRKKRGDGDRKRIDGPPERKRITDGSEQKSEKKIVSEEQKEDKKEKLVPPTGEKVTIFDNTETAVEVEEDESKKDEVNPSLSITEEIKDPKYLIKDLDIEKTETVNEAIGNRDIVVNNVAIIPNIKNMEIVGIVEEPESLEEKKPSSEIVKDDSEKHDNTYDNSCGIAEEDLHEEIIEPVTESLPKNVEESTTASPQMIEDVTEEIIQLPSDEQNAKKEDEPEPIKPVVNTADVVGHEEIIYEGDAEDGDDGEWIDDDGEWVDEDDDDGEWVDEDDDDGEEVKEPEVTNENKRQSILNINTSIDIIPKTPLNLSVHSSPVQEENSKQALPDSILDRIFREVDPQTMWVLRNTSLKTRAIIDNILKETFEQFDLSMDPLYFDVTSKENLGLVLNTLDLSPFALAMLLHEILKLDSQRIGYAFGQMFRVPSKIDKEYLTELIVDTLIILKQKKGVDIASVMLGLQQYYCFNHSELEFYQLFEAIEMSPQEVARFMQNHYHFNLSKSLPILLNVLDVDEVYIAEMCKTYANDDMDALARIISKVPVHLVRTSIHPDDVQGERVVVVNENGENVIVVLNNDEKNVDGESFKPIEPKHQQQNKSLSMGEWVEDEGEEGRVGGNGEEEEEEEDIEEVNDSMIVVENNESFSVMVGRILRFLNMNTKDVASFFKYLPEYSSYDEDEILEGLNWNQEQIDEMRQIMKEEQDKIARKMKELSKLIIQRRLSISSMNSPTSGKIKSPLTGSPSTPNLSITPNFSSSNTLF